MPASVMFAQPGNPGKVPGGEDLRLWASRRIGGGVHFSTEQIPPGPINDPSSNGQLTASRAPLNKKGSWMDAKSKFREAIRSCDEALDAAVKSEDRSKREVLEQLSALYRRLAELLVKYMRR